MSTSSVPSAPWARLANGLIGLVWVAALAGLAWVWLAWDPAWGPSMQASVSYGIVILTALLTLLWFALCSRSSWPTVLAVLSVVGVALLAAAASIRSVEVTGDMGVVLAYRWQPTGDEALARHRQAVGTIPLSNLALPSTTDEDMPAYRGIHRDGVVIGPPLSQNWTDNPPLELWRQPIGGGYSQFAAVGDFLVTLEQRGDREAVVCYDAATGRERWLHEYPAHFQEAMGGPGPRSTPTIDGDDVFSLGAEGELCCLDLLTGEVRWSRDLLPSDAPNLTWALSSSPLVFGERVIVNPGGPEGDGLMAVNRQSGETLWQRPGVEKLREGATQNRAGYSSPALVTLNGIEQLLNFDGWGLRSYQPDDGTLLWEYEFQNGPGVNVAQPVVLGDDRVFLAASYGEGCRMIRTSFVDGSWSAPEALWQNLNMRCKFTSPVLHEGFLYGLDEGILVCLDPETGERKWKQGRFGHGQILLVNGQILILSESGELVLVDASPDAYREFSRRSALGSGKTWNPPALVRGRVYIRDHHEMAAFDLSQDAAN